ncbi:MAG: hypothetical protein HOJ20_02520 [Rhodospirillaceae bacterium]|nr:hypothetical protein [Rhodospirillaceae bacterium]
MITGYDGRLPIRSMALTFAALLILSACANLPFGISTETTAERNGTEAATPRPTPRADFGVTIDGLGAYASGRDVTWEVTRTGPRRADYVAASPIGGGEQNALVVSVSAGDGWVDTITGRIGRRWIDERQYERFYGELTGFFDHVMQHRPRDFALDRWVENIHLSNRLERRGAWAFATETQTGVVISYVLTDGDLAFVATVDPDCAAQVTKGPEVWRFGPPDGICGGVFPR